MATSSGTRRDVRIRLESSWEGAGFAVATRAVSRFESDYRRMAQQQMRAEKELAEAVRQRAAEIEAAAARQREAMQSTGRVLLTVSGAAAVGMAVVTKSAMDWESAFAGVKKTVDGTPEQIAALEYELRTLAKTLPATHQEIAAVAEAAGQLGIARGDIAEFTETAINLGETTNLSADQAATSLAQLMNIMKTAPDSVDRLGSTLVALGNNGASTEQQIIDMALRLAGAGELIGATEGEVLATASALASMGVSAEAGGGATSRILQKVYSIVADGGDKMAAFAKVAGMSADEFAKAWRDDPIAALAAFADGLNGVEANGGNVVQTLRDLGIRSSEEQRILLQLKANTDLLTDSLALQADAWDANNALMEEANQRYQTAEARMQIARNQINDAAIDIGGNFLPVAADATEWVGQLATGFGSLPDPVKQFVTQLGAATTGAGLLVGGAAVAIPKLHELSETIKALRGSTSLLGRGLGSAASILTGPWGLALAGAGVALALFLQRQGQAQQKVESLRASLDEQTASVTDNTREIVAASLASKNWIEDMFGGASAAEGADILGIELTTLTDAATGNVAAMEQVNEVIAQWRAEIEASGNAGEMSTNRIQELTNAIDAVETAVRNNSGSVEEAIAKQEVINALTGEDGVQAMDDYAAASAGAGDANEWMGEAKTAAEELDTEIRDLIQSLQDLNSPTLDAREASRQWEAQLDEVAAALEKNGQNLDITTEAGRENQGVLDGLAQDAMALASAILEETGSEEDMRTSLEQSRQKLFETATQFGMSEQAAWDYVNSVLAIPEKADTVVELDTATASENLQIWLNESTGKRIKVFVDSYQGNTYDFDASNQFNTLAQARGGIVEFYAGGGLRRLNPTSAVAQIVPPNTWRVVGDRARDDESYIPINDDPRSHAVLAETNRRMGYEVQRLHAASVAGTHSAMPTGAGGTPAAAPAASSYDGPLAEVNVGTLVEGTPSDVGDEVGWQLRGVLR